MQCFSYYLHCSREKFAPYDPLETHYTDLLKSAMQNSISWELIRWERDIFSRILYGGKNITFDRICCDSDHFRCRNSYRDNSRLWGGAFDAVLMRLSDMLMAFPGSIFTIALVSFLGTGLPNLILAMTITGWTYYARISRSLVLSIKNNTYIEQARLGGANNFRIMTGYIIPNVMPSLLVNITQDIGSKLLTIAGLSLLGLGSQPPTPEWGYMLSEGKDYMYSAPWMLMAPGIVI